MSITISFKLIFKTTSQNFSLNSYGLISAKINMLNFVLISDYISHSIQPQSHKFVNLGVLGYSNNGQI